MLLSSATKIEVSIPPTEVFKIGNFVVTNTMVAMCVTVGIIILIAAVVRIFCIHRWNKNLQKVSLFRLLIETVVDMFDKNAKEQTGKNSGFVGAFYFGAVSIIFIGTLVELFGLRPVTTDLNLTLSLGLSTFFIIVALGFKERKLKRFLHYLNPINIIIDAVLPISLALRMFGSVFSGYLIMHLIYMLPFWTVFLGLPALGSVMFTIFHALIQSFIFMILPLNFINEATETDDLPLKRKIKKTKITKAKNIAA